MNQKASWGVSPPSTLGVSKETMDTFDAMYKQTHFNKTFYGKSLADLVCKNDQDRRLFMLGELSHLSLNK